MTGPGKRVGALLALLVAVGCGSSSPGPVGPGAKVTVSGLVVAIRPPAAPVPVAGVRITVIDPVGSPVLAALSDAHGAFSIPNVPQNLAGKIRLFINGMTGVGGPFITWNIEYSVTAATLDVGTIKLVEMEREFIVPVTTGLADLSVGNDGLTRATLRSPLAVSGAVDVGVRRAGLSLPTGTVLTFPPTAPLILNITRIPHEALPAVMPTAADGSPRFTQYLVALQPAGLTLGAPVNLQLPELDGVPAGNKTEFWLANPSTRQFELKGLGTVSLIPVERPPVLFAVSDAPSFIDRFEVYGAMPTCRSQVTNLVGRTVDVANGPVVGAQVSALGVSAVSDANGNFRLANAPLGCGAPMNVSLVASAQRPGAVFLSGGANTPPVSGGDTQVGDIRMTTPFYVVRARPSVQNGATLGGAPLNTTFDVYFSEPVDPATIDGVRIERATVGNMQCDFNAITGQALRDDRDTTHVRFVPDQDLAPAELYAARVDASRTRSAGGGMLSFDFRSLFLTVSPSDHTAPSAPDVVPVSSFAFVAGTSLGVAATSSDNTGIAGGRWQLCPGSANGCMTTGCLDGQAAATNTDVCLRYRTATLNAHIALPNVMADTEYCLLFYAKDASGNESSPSTPRLLQVVPPGEFFPFCGTAQKSAFVSSNGFITFDLADTDYTPTTVEFFSRSRVAAFYTDVDPRFDVQPPSNPDSRIFTNPVAGADPGFAITWWKTGIFNNLPGPNTFQIVLFKSGAIQLDYQTFSDSIPTTTQAFFMGVSCPGAPTNPPPPPTALLIPKDPAQFDQRIIAPWSGEPDYDYFEVPPGEMPTTRISRAFANRTFTFAPPGTQAPAPVPLFQQGFDLRTLDCDDCTQTVDIVFPGGSMPPDAAPDAGVDGPSDAILGDAILTGATTPN